MNKKRRPTSTSKSHRMRMDGGSHVSHCEAKPQITSSQLIARKYYYPAIKEQEKHLAYLLTRFLKGSRSNDQLKLAQLLCFYGSGKHLAKSYEKPLTALRWAIVDSLQQQMKTPSKPHLLCSTYTLLRDNTRKKRQLLIFGFSYKKQQLKSTEVPSRKDIKKILGENITSESSLNESEQFGKLSKCLKKVLKTQTAKGYKAFMAEMERKAQGKEKSRNMKDLILNLEKDFSSIQQDNPCQFSKESIYGLSELKKKSEKNNSKIELKIKEKVNPHFCHFNFIKKTVNNYDRSANSTSKNSGKSISLKKSKQGGTPDNNRMKSKSKSTTKKTLKPSDKKSKLTDTQKLYYDEVPEKHQQRDLKSSLKERTRKMEMQMGARSKKKGIRL